MNNDLSSPPAVNPDNLAVGMIRPNMQDIPQFAFPAGYGMRPMRLGEGVLWTEIQRASESWFTISDTLFDKQFGVDLPATASRCFFIINEQGDAIGTISAWYARDIRGQEYGRIHWVAIIPAYRGKGLVKPAMSYTMNVMAQWHERAYLDTSSGRIPAIKVYLDFGFLPDLELPDARAAWDKVAAVLKHPVLEAALA